MNNKRIVFYPIYADLQEVLMAKLMETYNFDGFEQLENKLIAYCTNILIDKILLLQITDVPFTIEDLPIQNWNALWESNFEPVVVDKFCAIRANFHEPVLTTKIEIIITPKMSFGTGHHATTYQVIQAMQKIDFTNKTVCDFGTGTGVLAILAEKLGATQIDAIDNDDWSIDNTIENCAINNCNNIKIEKHNKIFDKKYDIILANINKNILLLNMPEIAKSLKINGIIILSGILNTDENEMIESIASNKLKVIEVNNKNNWLCIITTN